MATIEQYENLPGVKVSYEDGNLNTGNQSQQANTKAVLLIGTAIDGPVGEPFSVNAVGGPKAAEKILGGLLERKQVLVDGEVRTTKVPHKGSLARTMWEMVRSGNEDVRLLRVSGRSAKTEIPIKDPNNELTQPLADALGNSLLPGNIAFSKPLGLASDQRLVKIEKVEEFTGTDLTKPAFKTFPDATGYKTVDATVGSETISFNKDFFRPKNTVKVTYNAKKRTYTEVTRTEDGVTKPSTKGLLTQDTSVTSYFQSEVSNWSDDPIHQVNVYVKSGASASAIPMVNSSGQRLWRVGKDDPAVTDKLTAPISALEYEQGGINFTSAYQAEVAKGTYPALTASVQVTADYFYYSDVSVSGSTSFAVPGAEKETFLKYTPLSGTLVVYYELNGARTNLVATTDYTLVYPSTDSGKIKVMVKAGVGPVGANLFAYYKTGEGSAEDAKLIVNGKYPGSLYGGIQDPKDTSTLYGVQVTVEYEVNANGTIDTDNRVIRFIKPEEKKTSSADKELRFRTKNLVGINTVREFANYVNGLSSNNIVQLEVPINVGDIPLTGLQVTDYTVSNGKYTYRPINLGEKYNTSTLKFAVYVDDSKTVTDPNRYPWLGSNGFFDPANLADTKELYEVLGGKYQLVEGTIDEYELVEQGVYSRLENYITDEIQLCDVYSNTAIGMTLEDGSLALDKDKSFSTQLAQHCAMVTAKTWETVSVVGTAPAPSTSLKDVQEYIDLLTKDITLTEEKEAYWISKGINPYFRNLHYMYNLATHEQILNDDGDPIDIGRYTNTVFGPEVGLSNDKLGLYLASGAPVYAGLISTLNVEVSTTNQAIPVTALRYNLSESQHNQLAGGRFVTFEAKRDLSGRQTIVVKDGMTSAAPGSDYQRLSTVRITHGTVQLIRKKADKFIGLPNGIAQRNSLATEIQAGLDKLKELGVLQNFKFSIYASAKDRVLGNAFITLELVPAYELRKIFTSVALRASL